MRDVSISPSWKLTPIWCGASFGEVDASLLGQRKALHSLSHPSLPQNPTGLTCPNARSTLTDRLACLREGGGKRGTCGWMGEKNPHPPTGRQGALTERNSSRLFRGAVASPFQHLLSAPSLWVSGPPRLGPLDSLALYSASFQTSKKNPPPTSARRSPTCALRCSAQWWKSKSAPRILSGHRTWHWKWIVLT